jgi:TonB family protein
VRLVVVLVISFAFWCVPSSAQTAGIQRAHEHIVQRLTRFLPRAYPQSHQAVVQIDLDREGNLRSLTLLQPTGSPSADRLLIKAIVDATPFNPQVIDALNGQPVALSLRF